MDEIKNNYSLKKKQKIKEITISNKKSLTEIKKKFSNEINIIPIKIPFSPKVKQNYTENFNATFHNKIFPKNKINNIEKKNTFRIKKIYMTPKIEPNYSNNASNMTTPRVIIKNFNYNNVYNINIDKEKNKNSLTNSLQYEFKNKNKNFYPNFTYNRPKTTSNINIKNNNISNTEKKEREQNIVVSRINSEKNILTKRKFKINIIGKNGLDNLDYEESKDKTLFYSIPYKPKEIKLTSTTTSIKSVDNNYFFPFNSNDLNILFEKINSIIISLSKDKEKYIDKKCQDFFDFYNKSSLKKLFPIFFKSNNKLILDSSINLCLFSIIVVYNLSSENLLNNDIINIIERILLFCKINFALFIRQIEIKYKTNFENLFQKYLINKSFSNITKEENLVNIIFQNSKSMTNGLKLIMNFYKAINPNFYNNIIEQFNNISIKTEEDFIYYFFNIISKNNLNQIKNNNISRNNSDNSIKYFSPRKKNAFENLSIKKNNIIMKKLVKRQRKENINKIKLDIPYIKTPLMKKYCLILSLQKTLCYKNMISNEMILRNGLFSFLSSIKPFYEIISFSTETKDFCDSIIDIIEQDKKYFDYKLYKEHCVLDNNNFVKDVSLIGRDISKIIIVDNDDKCFTLNKENEILIKSFNAENNNDNKLFELKKILRDIYIKNFDDVRIAIKMYKNDIVNNITLD